MLKSNEANSIIKKHKAARQVWFAPQMIIDIAAVVLCAMENKEVQKKLYREYGISNFALADIAEKLNKEVNK
jgi:hypothetical protein